MRKVTGYVVSGMIAAIASSESFSATAECFEFDNPPVGTTYEVNGAPLDTRHSTIRVQPFLIGTQASNHPRQLAEVVQSGLPSDAPPALQITSATIQVQPDTPASVITFDYAENTGPNDQQRQNFGVNGQRLTNLVGGLEQLDGARLGRTRLGGAATIAVSAEPDSDELPTWMRGTVTVTALDDGIRYIALGAVSQLLIDRFCIES